MAARARRHHSRSRKLTAKRPKAKAAAPKSKSAPKPKAKAKTAPLAAKAKAVVKAVKAPAKATAKAPAAKPAVRKKAAAPKPARPAILALIGKILDDAKAEDIVEIDLTGRNPITDFMVVASGRSQRHVQALAEQLAQKLRQEGYPANVEGLGAGDWVLVDALDAVVHLFRPEVRAFYDLERMWTDDTAARAAS